MDYVLVTGGCGGLGSSVVKRFLSEGSKVVVFDLSPADLKEFEEVRSNELLFYEVDLTKRSVVEEITKKLFLDGVRIKHCISLAGGALPEEFRGLENLKDELIEDSVRLNLCSHILLARNVLPLMKGCSSQNKSITFISSINAVMDFGLPAYSAAKAGILGLTRTLSAEIGKYNIRVNTVLPGTVQTKRTTSEPKRYEEYLKGSLLGRFATSEEITEVVYCVSEKFTCMTGQSVVADCGQTVSGHYENLEH